MVIGILLFISADRRTGNSHSRRRHWSGTGKLREIMGKRYSGSVGSPDIPLIPLNCYLLIVGQTNRIYEQRMV